MNTFNHIAFIMDGNGRWGLRKKKNRNYGHLKGLEVVKKIVRSLIKFNVPISTFYVFSSENWHRPKKEINYLFRLISLYFKKEINNIIQQGIKINIIGRFNSLPLNAKKILKLTMQKTSKNRNLVVNLAINYGSKNEIIDAFREFRKSSLNLNENNFQKYLGLKKPFPDILIRTGGYKRLSNFLLWQIAYSEIFFLDKLWPDFKEKDLKLIIKKYHKITRNFGRVKK